MARGDSHTAVTRNVTVMFTDIKGFTARVSGGSREDLAVLRRAHDRLLVPAFKHFNGTERENGTGPIPDPDPNWPCPLSSKVERLFVHIEKNLALVSRSGYLAFTARIVAAAKGSLAFSALAALGEIPAHHFKTPLVEKEEAL